MGFTSSATAVALGASVAAAAAAGGSTRQALRYLSLSSPRSFFTPAPSFTAARTRPRTSRIFPRFNRIFCTTAATADPEALVQPLRHSILLERLRSRHLKDSPKPLSPASPRHPAADAVKKSVNVSTFDELGLSGEVMGAVREMGIAVPTEIQCIGVPAVLEGKSVVLGSHTGSGKTLAYMLPLVQLLRHDEEMSGMMMKPRRPRAVVLCPTRELCEQVFHVAKSVSHHARFRSTMISGGGRIRPQEDSLNVPIDMVVGTPGRILQHIEEGNIVYGDIKYLVLDEADTMFDRGFGPDIRKFLAPLKNRAAKADNQGFQTVLVTATMTMAVQKLIDEEFQGIIHLRTSTLHKKIASARHDFIKLSGSENKLESLLQVLEPSLAKGNRVMVFCNTLNSSRAVDHFLSENQISTVNYHGEVPAEERVKNLKKFKSEEGDCPTLVCTDLAARGLDLDVDHVIMFDFPSNSIDYLHRTGRTARMGAKGKVTSLVAKKNQLLASRIEEAMRKNESLESLTMNNVEWDVAKSRQSSQKGKNPASGKTTYQKNKFSSATSKTHKIVNKAAWTSTRKPFAGKTGKPSTPTSTRKPFAGKTASTPTSTRKPFAGKTGKPSTPTSSQKPSARKPVVSRQVKETTGGLRKESSKRNKPFEKRKSDSTRAASKLSVVGFRGRSSGKREPLRPQ